MYSIQRTRDDVVLVTFGNVQATMELISEVNASLLSELETPAKGCIIDVNQLTQIDKILVTGLGRTSSRVVTINPEIKYFIASGENVWGKMAGILVRYLVPRNIHIVSNTEEALSILGIKQFA